MTVIKSNMAKSLHESLKKYWEYFYDGKIKAGCDEDCPEGCEEDHGNYELPETYTNFFDK